MLDGTGEVPRGTLQDEPIPTLVFPIQGTWPAWGSLEFTHIQKGSIMPPREMPASQDKPTQRKELSFVCVCVCVPHRGTELDNRAKDVCRLHSPWPDCYPTRGQPPRSEDSVPPSQSHHRTPTRG